MVSLPSARSFFDVSSPRQVWFVTGAHGVNEFYSVAFPPILPLLVADFGITYGQAGALLTVYYVTYSIFQLPAGLLADRIGQKRILTGGMLLLAAGVGVAGFADSYPLLLLAQAVAGIGGSTYHPSGMSIISDLETGATEGRAMGIHGLGGVVGTALAPALIGGLATLFDWRVALIAGAGVGLVYGIVFATLFSRPDDTAAPASDGGTVEESADADQSDSHAPRGLRARIHRLVKVPFAWWVVGLFVGNFLLSLEIGAVRTFATSYLFARAGESTSIANSIFFIMLVGAGISSLGGGHLADRFDRKLMGAATLGLSAVLLILTAFIPAVPLVLAGWFFLLGLVLYAIFPAKNALISAYSEREYSGGLFGIMLTAASLGNAVGPFLFGVVAERLGVTVAYPLIAVVGALGALSFLALRWT